MEFRVRLLGLAAGPVRSWLEAASVELREDADIVVWDPREAGPQPSGIAILPVTDPGQLVAGEQMEDWVDLRADAYAGDKPGLLQAIEYLSSASSPPESDHLGLTYLGALGAWVTSTPVGARILVDTRRVLGRSPSCDLVTRQGPHSDQNITARIHAIVESHPDGVLVRDAQSSNGTYLDGVRVEDDAIASSGSEIAVAARLRVRVG